jgi:hypothetical protein
LAGRVLLMIVYFLVRPVPGLVVLVFRRDLAKDAELPVLWHENAVLPRYTMWGSEMRFEWMTCVFP